MATDKGLATGIATNVYRFRTDEKRRAAETLVEKAFPQVEPARLYNAAEDYRYHRSPFRLTVYVADQAVHKAIHELMGLQYPATGYDIIEAEPISTLKCVPLSDEEIQQRNDHEEANARELMQICSAVTQADDLSIEQKSGYMAAVSKIHDKSQIVYLPVGDAAALFRRLLESA